MTSINYDSTSTSLNTIMFSIPSDAPKHNNITEDGTIIMVTDSVLGFMLVENIE